MAENFDALLSRLAEIAKAVNAFSSESVQLRAFEVLIAAWAGKPSVPPAGLGTGGAAASTRSGSQRRRRPRASQDGSNTTTPKRGTAKSSGLSVVGDLNLRPKGLDSFVDFASGKKPATAHERSAVSVYYLRHILKRPTVDLNDVYTCYKAANWRVPANLANSLAVTANRKGWLDTGSTGDIKLKTMGENFVEHDMGVAKKSAR